MQQDRPRRVQYFEITPISPPTEHLPPSKKQAERAKPESAKAAPSQQPIELDTSTAETPGSDLNVEERFQRVFDQDKEPGFLELREPREVTGVPPPGDERPARAESFSGRGAIGYDQPSFRYGYYTKVLQRALAAEWSRPPAPYPARLILTFRIERNGNVVGLRLVQSSGIPNFDQAALRSVTLAAPFPPLPRSFPSESLGVTVHFR